MLIDMHVHSSGISSCCKITADETVRQAKGVGLDGMFLTNHYFRGYVPDGDFDAFARRYVAEYENAKGFADKAGLLLFFGIELTAEAYDGAHILIYGVSPEFVLNNPRMMEYSRKELFDTVHSAGGILIHAHPLRRGGKTFSMEFLDGVEMNCHSKYEGPLYGDVAPFARQEKCLVTCGGDYHGDVSRRPLCGVHFPEGTDTAEQVRDYLLNAKILRLSLEEPDGSGREEYFERG